MFPVSRLKHIASLQIPRFRDLHDQTIVEGTRLFAELLATGYPFQEICATEEWILEHAGIAGKAGSRLTMCSPKEMERMSGMKSPQGVLAVIPLKKEAPSPDARFTILCDRISDPGNLGTIIRIADWFRADQVLATEGSAGFGNPKVIQASMGSWFRMKLASIGPEELKVQYSESHTLYGAVMDGDDLRSIKPTFPAIIVIGNEAAGISEPILYMCHHQVTIPGGAPQVPGSSAESLNAAIAAALLCYHFFTPDY
jgi:RNA methyltransferase, TrmH family